MTPIQREALDFIEEVAQTDLPRAQAMWRAVLELYVTCSSPGMSYR